jgi:gamma-glutamylcyclotransferase (GGCT)/AIG2-like uncharacterized protein YtfP
MHVFTYGSLMFPEVWRIVVGREFATVAGALAGYSIFRVADEPYPGITVSTPTSVVPGLIYLDVDAASIERLDRFEGDFYNRANVPIDCANGEQFTADAYIVRPQNRHLLTDEAWTPESFVASGGLAQFLARYQGFSWLEG